MKIFTLWLAAIGALLLLVAATKANADGFKEKHTPTPMSKNYYLIPQPGMACWPATWIKGGGRKYHYCLPCPKSEDKPKPPPKVNTVPEPGTIVLVGMAIAFLVIFTRRRKNDDFINDQEAGR
jgi:hypothetical protein